MRARRPPTELPLLEVADRAALRRWLEKNHASSSGVLLAVGKRDNAATSLTYEDAIQEGLAFGWIDSTARRLDADRFAMRFTPRRPGGNWSRSNKERIERLLQEGAMRPSGLAAIEAAKADGSWTRIDGVEELVVPDDLAEALASARGAAAGFETLPDSARKLALYWIASAKRPETRARRIEETVRKAAQGRGGGA
jgi:uncharacterized protein YdeI (YjbR/CyaY-like superfamily)